MADFLSIPRAILDLIFPFSCIGCRRRGEYCCTNCSSAIIARNQSFKIGGTTMYSGYSYANWELRTALHDLKYRKNFSTIPLIESLISRWALDCGHLIPEDCVLVPVPLHSQKFISRGFNQAECIATVLGELLDLPVRTDLLFRIQNDKSQTDSVSRDVNVIGAFAARKGFKGQIFLVDDVITSGSTMLSCLAALDDVGGVCRGGFSLCWGIGNR